MRNAIVAILHLRSELLHGRTSNPVESTKSSPLAGATYTSPSSRVSQSTSTSTRAATNPASSTKPPSPGNHLTTGAVAGIAIACAALGALIAVVVLYFLMKGQSRKRHRLAATSSRAPFERSSSRQPGYLNKTMREQPGNRDKGGAIERSPEEVTVENVLEQPKDDATIKQTVATLFKAIEDHAANYYMDTPSRIGQPSKEPKTYPSNLPTGINAQSDVDFEPLLSDRLSRSSAIASLITAQVLDAIDFFGVPEKSLLPEMVTSFLRSAANQVKDNQRSRLNLSRWRTGTAYLLGPEESPRQRAQSQVVMDALIADVDSVVGSYIDPETDKDRHHHLVKICKRAQELGLLLLSQPAEWRFHWSDAAIAANAQKTATQTQRGEKSKKLFFVVQPQLRRITDNVARKLDHPLIVLEWQVLH